jgi:predicted protein tyrosine phosphatase
MIKKVKIYNRFNMENFALTGGINFPYYNQPWHLVSIYGDDVEFLTENNKNIFREMGCKNFLSLNFSDITDNQYEKVRVSYPRTILFNQEHAKQIVDFIRDIQGKKEDSVLVAHCQAGISRSGAVGTFVNDYCGLDYSDFLRENPYIMANPYVLRLLRREAGMTPSFEWHDGIDHNVDGKIIIP